MPVKPVYFRDGDPRLAHVENRGNFSEYVRRLIDQDMQGSTLAQVVEEAVARALAGVSSTGMRPSELVPMELIDGLLLGDGSN